MMVLGNKAEKAKAVDDDDDGDSEEKKLLLSITSGFKEQSEIAQQLFDFITEVFRLDAETPLVIVNYPYLSSMLERGMILTENQFLRKSMSERIKAMGISVLPRSLRRCLPLSSPSPKSLNMRVAAAIFTLT